MIKHLFFFLICILYANPAYANLSFKLEWYFSEEQVNTIPIGVDDSRVVYLEDRMLWSKPREGVSFAQLEERARVLTAWVDARLSGGIAPLEVGDVVQAAEDIRVAQTAVYQPELDSGPERTPTLKPDDESLLEDSDICDGVWMSGVESYVFVDLHRNEAGIHGTEFRECGIARDHVEDFIVFKDEHSADVIRLTSIGETRLSAPIAFDSVHDFFENGFNTVAYLPNVFAAYGDILVFVDGIAYADTDFKFADTANGQIIAMNLEPDALREVRIEVFGEEDRVFLADAGAGIPHLWVLGHVDTMIAQKSFVVRIPNDPAQFFDYYDESVGQMVGLVNETSIIMLGNVVLPHFFAYVNVEKDAVETPLVWYPTRDAAETSLDVLPDWLARVDAALPPAHAYDNLLIVGDVGDEGASPQLARVLVNAHGVLEWRNFEPIYHLAFKNDTSAYVFADLKDGEYWLTRDEITYHKIAVWDYAQTIITP